MRIGFFYQKTTPESVIHLEVAKPMLASIRKVMPDVKVTQFTDETSEALEGVDDVVRIGGDMPMAMRRMTHHSQVDGDWCFCDTDVIFRKDVREVFEEPFDVAITDRVKTYMDGGQYAKAQPYNIGVTFSRNPKFWKLVLQSLKNFPKMFQEWEGDQMVVNGLALTPQTPFDIVVLPGYVYNFTPKHKTTNLDHASIVHLKGGRKDWIKEIS